MTVREALPTILQTRALNLDKICRLGRSYIGLEVCRIGIDNCTDRPSRGLRRSVDSRSYFSRRWCFATRRDPTIAACDRLSILRWNRLQYEVSIGVVCSYVFGLQSMNWSLPKLS